MSRREFTILIFLILLVALGGTLFQKFQNPGYLKKPYIQEKVLFDTYVSIKAYGRNQKKVEKAVKKALKEMAKVDNLMNYYSPQSELSLINRGATKKPVKVSPEMIEVLVLSKSYGKKTKGNFNIAIGPLMDLWSFGRKEYLPTEEELEQVLPLVDLEAIKIDQKKGTVRLEKKGMKLDLGGVSKGYGVDLAIKILKKEGIAKALVTTGSSTAILDSKPKGKPWQVGIQHPRKKLGKLLGILSLKNKNIATSGDYQQYFMRDGKRYHHILNPQTGLPAEGIISLTLVTEKDNLEADILSTALLVMGYPSALKFIEKDKNLEGIIVTSSGKVYLSSGLNRRIFRPYPQ